MGTRRVPERAPAPNRHPAGSSAEGAAEEELEGPGVRADSRTYLLNVRPENRTTFCAIISQLTEETQPSFEVTLKSRAVSEDCDAKFTCIVSGFPEPELTWYKDDEEMDRYCGLPKYAILRNGKRHTLQLYKCKEEDAAIYQASARNSKGIVSCSSVLEVGTMTEYKIHQRWFAKLKRKAEAKMREIEQSRKRGKENVENKLRTLSPERIQRKRRFSAEDGKKTPASVDKEDVINAHIPDPTSRLQADVDDLVEQQLMNGESEFPNEIMPRPTGGEVTTNGYASLENLGEDGKEFLAYVYETVEITTKRPTAKESSAKKKKKEEEPAAVPLEVKREEKATTSGIKKGDGPSPVAVRSRFVAVPSKAQAHERMEVDKSAGNRKAVTVSPKIPKLTLARDPKKNKEAGPLKSKEQEGSNPQLCSTPSKGEGYFSLREMYLENTALPAEEKKTPPIPERVRSKIKPDHQGLQIAKEKPPEMLKIVPPKSGQEGPKLISRHDQVQKEELAGSEPQLKDTIGLTVMEMDVKSPFVDFKNKELKRQSQVPMPGPEIQPPLPVEKEPVCETTSLPSTSFLNVPDKSFVELDLLNSVLPDARPLCETVAASITPKARQNVLPPGKDDIKSSVSDAHREQLVFEAPSEVMAREEALQKYQRLEMEYQALQRAYALLQQQLEQTLNTDREVKDVKLNATPFSTETSTLGKVVSNEDSKAPVTEPNKPHPPASESNVSAPEMLESKDPADALKFPVPESTEPKPPARKLKAHAPESSITAPVLKSPALESTEPKTIQPVLNTPAPEQSEPIPPARKTKAPPSETKRVAPEQKSATTEPSESKVSALAMKSSLPEPSLTESLTPETKTPLPGPKVPESEMKALATEPTMPAPQPKAFAPKSNKDTKNSVQNVYVADVPVYMETELSGKETSGCIPKPDKFTKQNVDYEAAEQLLDKSKKPFVHSIDIPLTVMERASEGKGHFKENDTVEMEVRDKDTQAQLALNTEVMGADILQHIDVLKSTLKECVPGYGTETFLEIAECPAEVEMTEETKQDQQTSSTWTALSSCWVGEHQPCTEIDLSTIEKKSLSTSHEIVGKVSGEVEDASVDVIEIISPCADEGIHPPLTDPLPYLSILSHHHEVPQHKTDLSSTEVPISSSSPPSEESVATLLRDVKKELDTGTPSDMASLTEADNAIVSLQRERVSPNEDYEVEIMLQVPQGEANDDKKQVVLETKGQAIAETVFKVETLPPDSSETKEPMSIAVTVPLVSQGTQEVVSADIFMDQEKQNSGFVASLKNSLLMLLNITKTETDTNKGDTKDEVKVDKEGKVDDCTNKSLFPDMGIVGSNPATGAIRETAKNDAYIQKEESLTSSSTSGIMTPVSDDDMVQNVLQLSPTTSRTFAEAIDKELFPNMESPCTSPRTARKTDGVNSKELFSSKEDLHLSPATSRRLTGKVASETESMSSSVPSIVVANVPQTDSVVATDVLPDLQLDENEMGTSEENVSMIPAATPQELALGARRKIYLSKPKQLDDAESNALDSTTVSGNTNRSSPNVSPGLSRRNHTLLQANMASQSPPMERRSPGLARKMATLEVPKIHEESTEVKTSEGTILEEKNYSAEMKEDSMELKKANDPYKAPQVIRKIRAEQFSDASGNLKLWCQFFNILSDSVISWFKDEYPVAEAKRSAGDEGQVALAIVQASKNDCGVYQCTIKNNYGTDSTDFLLSAEVLSGFITREETEVGEEIEMTPMVFAKGLADSGYWGDKFFGRIATEDVNVGKGYLRKVLRVKVIYGLEPLFESGKTCIIKIRNLITFGTKSESTLVEKNYDLTIQGCKIQNTTREYSKIFAAEARVVPNFGQVPEIIPLNLIYRPANNIPYATIEDDLEGQFEKYCTKDKSGNLQMKNTSEIEKKCCAFQHWAYQWTNGNFLITDLQGVGWKITNVAIATKTKGYQGLKESCCPASLDLFASVHQCNSYCEMLGLRSLKSIDTLQTPTKPKGSKSPSIGRKAGSTQSSPQIPKKGMPSPQGTRKSAISPKTARKSAEAGEPQPSVKHKAVEMPKSVRMR